MSRSLRLDLQIHGKIPSAITSAEIRKTTRGVLRELDIKRAEIGLVFLDERQMTKANFAYRKLNKPTDVLSFGYSVPGASVIPAKVGIRSRMDPRFHGNDEGRAGERDELVGDILICPSYAKVQAKERKISLAEELKRLLVHGLLHLSGMDHATARTEKRMFGLQEKLVREV